MIRAVIFDVDGTLVDTVDLHARAWQETFEHFGYQTRYEDVRSQIGKGGDQLMPVFVPKEDLERRGKEIDSFRGDLFKRKYIGQARGFHRTRALFQRILADGKAVALASSAKADELAHYKRAADIDDLVDTETASEDADKSKPYPDIFQAALDRLGVRPEEAVVVGDTPWDAEAATRAGIPVIGVLCGGFAEEDLRAAGCREVWKDPADLLVHIRRSIIGQPANGTFAVAGGLLRTIGKHGSHAMNVENTIRDTYDTVFGGERNLSTLERVTSVGLGLIMAAAGVNRADLPGAVMGLTGGALVARGMSGHCPIKSAMGYDSHGQVTHQGYGHGDAAEEARQDRAMATHAM